MKRFANRAILWYHILHWIDKSDTFIHMYVHTLNNKGICNIAYAISRCQLRKCYYNRVWMFLVEERCRGICLIESSNISTAWRRNGKSTAAMVAMAATSTLAYITHETERHTIVNWKKLHIFLVRMHDNKITQASLNVHTHTHTHAPQIVWCIHQLDFTSTHCVCFFFFLFGLYHFAYSFIHCNTHSAL